MSTANVRTGNDLPMTTIITIARRIPGTARKTSVILRIASSIDAANVCRDTTEYHADHDS